jgi:hypothetical protein
MESSEEKKQGLYSVHNFTLAKFASREENRYMLQAILVTPDETAATNGHYLVRCTTVNSGKTLDSYPVVPGVGELGADRFLLSTASANQIAKNIPRKETIPVLNCAAPIKPISLNKDATERQVGFVTTDLGSAKPVIEREIRGAFPNIDAVMPTADQEVVAKFTVSAKYLKELAEYFCKLATAQGQAYDPVTITVYKGSEEYAKKNDGRTDKAIKLDGKNDDQSAAALLMPLRV